MSRPEAALERQVLLSIGQTPGLALFRNEVGEGHYGAIGARLLKLAAPHGRELTDAVKLLLNTTRVHYGLHVGSADLIGVVAVDITPAMVGKRIGRMVSMELKSESGTMRPEQEVWLHRMRELGAAADEIRSPGMAALAIERARRGE